MVGCISALVVTIQQFRWIQMQLFAFTLVRAKALQWQCLKWQCLIKPYSHWQCLNKPYSHWRTALYFADWKDSKDPIKWDVMWMGIWCAWDGHDGIEDNHVQIASYRWSVDVNGTLSFCMNSFLLIQPLPSIDKHYIRVWTNVSHLEIVWRWAPVLTVLWAQWQFEHIPETPLYWPAHSGRSTQCCLQETDRASDACSMDLSQKTVIALQIYDNTWLEHYFFSSLANLDWGSDLLCSRLTH